MKALLHRGTCCRHTLCLCRNWYDLIISLSLVFLSFLCFYLSPSYLFVVVCENREEPWSWFQYLWWHQRPGEPLQTLRHGMTRPGLPANHGPSHPPALPQSCHGNCCSFPQRLVCPSVGEAAVDLNFEWLWASDLTRQTFGKTNCWWQLNHLKYYTFPLQDR